MAKGITYIYFANIPLESLEGREVKVVEIQTYSERRTIRCFPTPGRNGIEYVPDFHGITKFG
jgi:hypothetical protein